jgi:plasmid stabilization system protein ParE
MKLRFTPRAARDLAEIADYIREYSPQAALHVRAAILELAAEFGFVSAYRTATEGRGRAKASDAAVSLFGLLHR